MPLTRSQKMAVLLGGNAYLSKLATIAPNNLIGWWRMAELSSGSVSLDSSREANNGAYTAVTLGQTGIGDGLTAASFDGSTSYNNIYSASLNTAFSAAEGALAIWYQVGSGVLTDATQRRLAYISADGNNRIFFTRNATNNEFEARYAAGAVNKGFVFTNSSTGWNHLLITWSVAADQVNAASNGVSLGSALTGLGTWAGALAAAGCFLGARTSVPADPWKGLLAHAMLWGGAGSPATVWAARTLLATV